MIGRTNATSGSPIKIGGITTKDKSTDDSYTLADGRYIKDTDEIFTGLKPYLEVQSEPGLYVKHPRIFPSPRAGMLNKNGMLISWSSEWYISTSINGITWTSRTYPFGTDRTKDIAYGNNIFVAISTKGIATSTNGITWVIRSSTLGGYDITYAVGKFIIVDEYVTWISSNGITWISGSLTVNERFGGIVGNDSIVVAAQRDKTYYLYYSMDAITWVPITNIKLLNMGMLYFKNNQFLCTTKDQHRHFWCSNDGMNWIEKNVYGHSNWDGIEIIDDNILLYSDLGRYNLITQDKVYFKQITQSEYHFGPQEVVDGNAILSGYDALYIAPMEYKLKLPIFKTPTYIKYK